MQTQASVKTKCDGCGTTLGSSAYPDKRGTLSIHLMDGQDEHGYDRHNRYDYCGEQCLLKHLLARSKQSKGTQQEAIASVRAGKGLLELDVTQDPQYKQRVAAKAEPAK